MDSVGLVDDNTIRISLKSAPAGLFGIMSTSGRGGMASKAAVDKNGEEWLATHYAGTGPFELADWKLNDRQMRRLARATRGLRHDDIKKAVDFLTAR